MFTSNPHLIDRDLALEFKTTEGTDMIEFEFTERRPGTPYKKKDHLVIHFSESALNREISYRQTLRAQAAMTSRGASSIRDRKKFQTSARYYHQTIALLSEARDLLKNDHGMQ